MSGGAGRRGGRMLAVAVAVAVAALGGWWWSERGAAPRAQEDDAWSRPVPVRTVAAQAGELALRLDAIGTVTPLATVTVRSRVDGELLRVAFEEGETVRKGQLLAEIDPARYRVRLEQAEGQRQQNLAQLKNAESELARYEALYAQDSIARQQVEAQAALVNRLRGTLQADRAQVDEARLNLAWTRIEAPIGGRLGLRRVDPGNLVAAGDATGLVTITQTRPIAVMFTIPEQELGAVREQLRAGRRLEVEVRSRDDRHGLARGMLRTVDNQIDTATGTVRLKAEFANADDALFPNQFVNVRLFVGSVPDAVTIPADAVQYGSAGPYAYVVADGKARVQALALGAGDGERVAIQRGLKAGDAVVLEGLDRLRDGKEVVLVDAPAAAR